jgi:hypothetical protein
VGSPTSRRAIAIGAITGLVIGTIVSLVTDFPFAPEGGLLLGGLAGWIYRRKLG